MYFMSNMNVCIQAKYSLKASCYADDAEPKTCINH